MIALSFLCGAMILLENEVDPIITPSVSSIGQLIEHAWVREELSR